jgi:hypothetical protein
MKFLKLTKKENVEMAHERNGSVFCSVADPHHFVADPDPAFHFDAYPDPASQNDADPDPQHCFF